MGNWCPSRKQISDLQTESALTSSQKSIDVSKLNINLEEILKCTLTSQTPAIRLSSQNNQTLPVLISLNTKGEEKKEEVTFRPPIDLVCVIDRSGSMSGEKIKLVKDSLKYLVSILEPSDRLALVTFENNAQTLNNFLAMTESNKETIRPLIESIPASGGTNIHVGLETAMLLLKKRKYKNKVSSIFLLSDGQDNNTGEVLPKLEKTMQDLKLDQSFTINTFGYGADHDPETMKRIAEITDGDFSFIEVLDKVDEFFVAALGGLASCIGENLIIKVNAKTNPILSDLRISRVYGDSWEYDETTKTHTFKMKNLMMGITRELVVELNIPPSKKIVDDINRNKELVHAEIEVTSLVDKKVIKKSLDLNITFYNENEEIPQGLAKKNEEVVVHHLRVNGAEAIKNARLLADQGKFDESKQVIQENLKELEKEEFKEDKRITVLAKDLKYIEENCNQRDYSKKGKMFMCGQERYHKVQHLTNLSSEYEALYANSGQERFLKEMRMKKK